MAESYRRQYGCDFITLIPTNIYGPNQRYTPLNSLLIPALIAKFHEAKEQKETNIKTWGTGRPLRDFLYSDDLADAAIYCMNSYSDIAPINVGSSKDVSVAQVAQLVAKTVGYQGVISFDPSMPEGVHVRLQDVSRISNMGWAPRVSLEEGLQLTYSDYLKKLNEGGR